MKSITREEALNLVREANSLTRDDIPALQEERLRELVAHAREKSALYREKYKHLPDNPALEDLPVMTKQELTSNMQKLVCDPEFSKEELQAYITDLDNLGFLSWASTVFPLLRAQPESRCVCCVIRAMWQLTVLFCRFGSLKVSSLNIFRA